MARLYILTLGEGRENYRPDPFPGSEEALERGCVCPEDQPWPGKLAIHEDCEVHELKAHETKH